MRIRAGNSSVLFVLTLLAVIVFAASVAQAQRRGRGGGGDIIELGERGQSETVSGRTTGTINASRETAPAEGACLGFVPLRPNHRLVLDRDFRRVTVSVTSDADTTLVVHGPGGTRCNDDTDGLNPVLSGEWVAGTYNIYVGTYYEGVTTDYELTVRQGRHGGWGSGEGGSEESASTTLDVSATRATYASLTVPPSPIPAPLALDGRSGGPVDTSYLGTSPYGPCRGFASGQPNHILTMTEAAPILLAVDGGPGDTTLLIQGPLGWMCVDDTDTVDPSLVADLVPGSYLVWVGSYIASESWDYRLTVATAIGEGWSAGPSSFSFSGSFEGADVSFTGATVDEIYASCQSHLSRTGGAHMVDDVVLFGQRSHNASSYWDEEQLCAMVALNSRPNDGLDWPAAGTGSIEGMPFAIYGDVDTARAVAQTYIPRMGSAGWIDDIVINGASARNASSYWEPAVVGAIVAYNIVPSDVTVIAQGTIEAIPFTFGGYSRDDIGSACNAFMASGVDTTWVDDVTVNGVHRHNAPSFWNASEICMLVTSLATE